MFDKMKIHKKAWLKFEKWIYENYRIENMEVEIEVRCEEYNLREYFGHHPDFIISVMPFFFDENGISINYNSFDGKKSMFFYDYSIKFKNEDIRHYFQSDIKYYIRNNDDFKDRKICFIASCIDAFSKLENILNKHKGGDN